MHSRGMGKYNNKFASEIICLMDPESPKVFTVIFDYVSIQSNLEVSLMNNSQNPSMEIAKKQKNGSFFTLIKEKCMLFNYYIMWDL